MLISVKFVFFGNLCFCCFEWILVEVCVGLWMIAHVFLEASPEKGEADHKPYGTLIRGAPFFGTLAHRTRIANCADSEIHGIDAMAMQIMMNPLPGASSSLKGQRFWVLVL